MRKIAIIMAMVLVLCGAFAMSAQAVPSFDLDFTIGPVQTGASVNFTSPLAFVGTDIVVTAVTGLTTPINPGVTLPITGGLLNFTTGSLISVDPQHWNFGSDNSSISIFGDIGKGAGNEALLQGTVTSAVVLTPDSNGFSAARVTFADIKADDLAAFFGVPKSLLGSLNFGFFPVDSPVPPNSFSSTDVGSGDVHNLPIPVPPSLVLLGSGLLGLVGFRFRRNRG